MTRWEYKIINIRSENYRLDPAYTPELDSLGKLGWELVGLTSVNFKSGATDNLAMVFKRRPTQLAIDRLAQVAKPGLNFLAASRQSSQCRRRFLGAPAGHPRLHRSLPGFCRPARCCLATRRRDRRSGP